MSSLRRFRFSLTVHPAGLALLAAALLWLPSGMALGFMLALLCHETAHLLTMLLCGIKACAIELTPFGGVADVPGLEKLSPFRQGLIALSGVSVSALLALLCRYFSPSSQLGIGFFRASASLALLNCLPLWPLDGARALMALVAKTGFRRQAGKVMLYLAFIASGGLLALGVYGAALGMINPSLFLLPPYLCYAAVQSAAGDEIRLTEQALRTCARIRTGHIFSVRDYMIYGAPTPTELLRMLKNQGQRQIPLLHLFSRDGSKEEGTLSPPQIAELLERSPSLFSREDGISSTKNIDKRQGL